MNGHSTLAIAVRGSLRSRLRVTEQTASTRRAELPLQFFERYTRSLAAETPTGEMIIFKVVEVEQDRFARVEAPAAAGLFGERVKSFFNGGGQAQHKHRGLSDIVVHVACVGAFSMPTRIERIRPRDGLDEQPFKTERGYELVDRRIPERRHHVENSTFVRSLEEAAYLVEQGYAIRMGSPGKRPSLISPAGLRIMRS